MQDQRSTNPIDGLNETDAQAANAHVRLEMVEGLMPCLVGREKEVDTMKRVHGNSLLLRLAGMLSFAVAAAGQSATPELRQPDGTIQVATASIAVGVGATGVDGTLTFKGKEHTFTVKGLSLTDLGIGNATVKGNVYNLSKLEDFAGKYAVTEPHFELGGAGPP